GLVADAADCYGLEIGVLTALDGFAELSAKNLVAAIDASRSRPLSSLLVALGIRHVGGTVAKALASGFGELDMILGATEPELAAVEGVGPTIATSVASFFSSDANLSVVAKLRAAGVSFGARAGNALPQNLAGKSVVVTGTLASYSREEAEAAIVGRGGKSPGSVSAKTTAVVAGASPGASKITRAEALGVVIIDEAAFGVLLQTGELP
ncbi:MAG: helix-hairpin-helix domain-containing protein, partial [Acidimicrobiales bacterium]